MQYKKQIQKTIKNKSAYTITITFTNGETKIYMVDKYLMTKQTLTIHAKMSIKYNFNKIRTVKIIQKIKDIIEITQFSHHKFKENK